MTTLLKLSQLSRKNHSGCKMYVLTYTGTVGHCLKLPIGYLFYAAINYYMSCKMYISIFELFCDKFINQLCMLKNNSCVC